MGVLREELHRQANYLRDIGIYDCQVNFRVDCSERTTNEVLREQKRRMEGA